MAKKQTTVAKKIEKPKITRKGVHSKNNTSQLKGSKNYQKLYKGQGK